MTTDKVLAAIKRLRVGTGSLACLGCGHEHDCGIHGCAILREAADLIERLEKEKAALKEHCEMLQRMLMQETAGQEAYRKSTDVDFGDLDAVTNAIVIEAMALWLSGELDRLEGTP